MPTSILLSNLLLLNLASTPSIEPYSLSEQDSVFVQAHYRDRSSSNRSSGGSGRREILGFNYSASSQPFELITAATD